ncbi:MAG: amidohydrolase [Desulfobacterales bacterium]|nr:amidohydrolase [Desulfobacterales bacterium]
MGYDIVIHNGIIVTMNPGFDVIQNGLIGIKNGKIEQVSAKQTGAALPKAKETIDAAGGIILPGLINTHTHLPMTLFRGLADDLPLKVWLNEHIFPAEASYINPETVRFGALLGCAELILSGTTTLCDGYFLEDHVAEAVHHSGLRAVLGHGVIDFPAPGIPNPSRNIHTALEFVEKWREASPLIKPSVFCHSPYTCCADTLKKAKEAAAAKGVLFQIHAAETKNEFDQALKDHGKTPVEYLDGIGILDSDTLLVHAIWLKESDIRLIANRKASVSVTTESEMKLASGIAPVPDLIHAGIAVGLGTDGCASNNDQDLFREMDVTAKLHKVNALDPTVMDAGTVLTMATIGGAKAIGLDKEIGSLEIGKQADVLVVDTRSPHLFPMYNPVSHLVYSAKGSDVRDVIVAGRVILKDRKLLTLDMADIYEKVNAISGRIRKK